MSVFVCRLLFFVRIGLDPDEAVPKAVKRHVAISSRWFRLRMEPWESCVKAAAVRVVIDHNVFAGGERFRVEMFNGDAVGRRFISCVDSKLVCRHSYAPTACCWRRREKTKVHFP